MTDIPDEERGKPAAQGQQEDVRVADATSANWVDRFAPLPTRPYLRLSRADRPAHGTTSPTVISTQRSPEPAPARSRQVK